MQEFGKMHVAQRPFILRFCANPCCMDIPTWVKHNTSIHDKFFPKKKHLQQQ